MTERNAIMTQQSELVPKPDEAQVSSCNRMCVCNVKNSCFVFLSLDRTWNQFHHGLGYYKLVIYRPPLESINQTEGKLE